MNTTAQYLDEGRLVAPLLEGHAGFCRFYNGTRERLGQSIRWELDPAPGEFHISIAGHTATIYVPRYPADLLDAHEIAHELGHIILKRQGFPMVHGANTLAALLGGGVFADILIDRQLARLYGLVCVNAPQWVIPERDPFHPLEYVQWVILTLYRQLDHKATGASGLSPYFVQMVEKHPNIAAEAARWVQIASERGFNTPAKMRERLTEIVDYFGLHSVCEVN